MMNRFNSTLKIGEIVNAFPKAADIFKEYRVDFCCGGNRPLSEAINEQNINESELLYKINSEYEIYEANAKDKNWAEASTSEIIEQILNKHHAYLWSELPKISKLSTTILRVHGPHYSELSKVHKLFSTLKMELEEHLNKEETIQYPAIKEYERTNSQSDLKKAVDIIDDLESEHTNAGDILKELRKITNDFTMPEGGCETFDLTYQKLHELESDVFQHIHLENNILFPRLRNLLNK
ncbi:iron-sulfur cluster repair di-iron protein [Sedimentibacter sp.]|uniref:iron-sulfur cluster repair di-iron protein n=1 Tax=Sedimentibacter sp. TaxID=1960295 RepID=UPI0037D9B8B8